MNVIRIILDDLSNTSSTTEKKKILKQCGKEKLWMKFIKYALDSGKTYGSKKVPFTDYCIECKDNDIFNELDGLSTQTLNEKGKLVRNGKINHLSAMCNYLDCDDLVEIILKKDLRCGVGARMINDVFPRHIDIVPYQRYKSMKFLKNIDFSSYILAQLKMNGLFSYYSLENDLFTTRNNKTYTVPNMDYFDLAEALNEDEPLVFIGEGLIVGPDGEYLDRQTSNGIVNSFIQTDSKEHKENFKHIIWYYLTEKEYYDGVSTVPYVYRMDKLEEAFDLVTPDKVRLCETTQINSIEEAHAWYKSKRKLKEEGCIIKDANRLTWEDNKSGSKYGVKMKARAQVEVRIVDAYYGEPGKKWEHYLGGLIVESEDGKIRSKVGMGFSDDLRYLGVPYWSELRGGIITIEIGDITKARNKQMYAFESSSFVETRFNEKDVANTYEECKEELANS